MIAATLALVLGAQPPTGSATPPAQPVDPRAAPPAPAPSSAPVAPPPTAEPSPVAPPTTASPFAAPPPGAAPPPPPPPYRPVEVEHAPTVMRRSEPTYPDLPIRYRIAAQLEFASTVATHGSYEAFDADNRLPAVGVGVRGDAPLGRGLVFLGGGVGYRYGASTGAIYGALDTGLKLHEPYAFVRLSVVPVEGVDVYAEAGAGASIYRMRFDSHPGSLDGNRSVVGATIQGLAGVALYLPKKWLPRRGSAHATPGLDLGFGWNYRTRVDTRPTLDTPDDAIDGSASDPGKLFAQGFLWRLGIFVRFM